MPSASVGLSYGTPRYAAADSPMAKTAPTFYNDRQPSPTVMKTTRTFLLSSVALILPVSVFAAPTASTVLHSVYETNVPLQYTFESHKEEGGTVATVKASGMQEGRGTSWYKQRSDISLAVEKNGDRLSLHAKLAIFGDTLYLRIAGADITADGTTKHMESTQWAKMPIDMTKYDLGMFPFLGPWNALMMDATGSSDAWEHFRADADTLTVESERYKSGTAYRMHNTGAPVLRARFNTGKTGEFLYGKAYMQDGSATLSGETQPHGKGVVVEVPKQTIDASTLKNMLKENGIFAFLSDMEWESAQTTSMKTKDANMQKQTPVTTRYARPVYVPREEPACYQTGYAMAGCGIRYSKREIHENNDARALERGWKERVSDERIIDAYDAVAVRFETAAQRNDMHEAKTMLSNFTIRASGSADTDIWLNDDILPFFMPTEPSVINQTVFLRDGDESYGVAIEKVTRTASGRRRYFVIVLLLERSGGQPVVADIFINATLRDLKGKGWID